ncbi:MAG: putative glycosyltransferase EpsH [Alphaproteobacteria bacterium ADurb.Bin438]|nr:MAG: putative glycosyltransferase EpsH [Alphaproteobacteria bacterium ADurb.Bin438]
MQEFVKNDQRFKAFKIDNQGISKARAFGLQNAEGEYVSFVDSDDFITHNYIESLYNEAVKTGVDIVANTHVTRYYSDTKQKVKSNKHDVGVHDITPQLIYKSIGLIVLWNKLYKTEFLKKHHASFPIGKVHEDNYFYALIMPYLKQIAIINEPSYFYRVRRPDSIMFNARKISDKHDMLDVFLALKEKYIKEGLINDYILPFGILRSQFKHFNDKRKMLNMIYDAISDLDIDMRRLRSKDKAFVRNVLNKNYYTLLIKSWF